MSSAPTLDLAPGATLGACFIGFLFAAVLYGVTLMQIHYYFVRNARKEPVMKILVLFLWVLGTVHISFIAAALYHYLVQNFENPLAPLFSFWSLPAMVALSCAIECIVRGVFIHKVWILSQNRCLTAILALMNCGVVAVGVLFTCEAFRQRTLNDILTNATWIALAAFLTDFLLDLIISVSIAVCLRKVRQGSPSTTQFIDKIIGFALKTGVLTAAMSLAVLILFVHNRHSFAFMGMYFPFAQVFFATLLASLNNRKLAREAQDVYSPGRKSIALDAERGQCMARSGPTYSNHSSLGSTWAAARNHEQHATASVLRASETALVPNRRPPSALFVAQ